jgi:hypothetical protein
VEIAKLNFDPRYYNLTPQEMMQIDFGDYFARMRTQMKRIRSFQLPDGLVMWSRAFSLLYGLNAELARRAPARRALPSSPNSCWAGPRQRIPAFPASGAV